MEFYILCFVKIPDFARDPCNSLITHAFVKTFTRTFTTQGFKKCLQLIYVYFFSLWNLLNIFFIIILLQIMGSNPMFAGNPQLRDQFIRNLPQLTEQVIFFKLH